MVIFSRSLNEHVQHVCDVLHRLLENKLYAKGEKCEFHVDTVSFLSYVVEREQLRADPAKLEAEKKWPIPSTHNAMLLRFFYLVRDGQHSF